MRPSFLFFVFLMCNVCNYRFVVVDGVFRSFFSVLFLLFSFRIFFFFWTFDDFHGLINYPSAKYPVWRYSSTFSTVIITMRIVQCLPGSAWRLRWVVPCCMTQFHELPQKSVVSVNEWMHVKARTVRTSLCPYIALFVKKKTCQNLSDWFVLSCLVLSPR